LPTDTATDHLREPVRLHHRRRGGAIQADDGTMVACTCLAGFDAMLIDVCPDQDVTGDMASDTAPASGVLVYGPGESTRVAAGSSSSVATWISNRHALPGVDAAGTLNCEAVVAVRGAGSLTSFIRRSGTPAAQAVGYLWEQESQTPVAGKTRKHRGQT
jgi:hypothetical protein